MKSVFRERDPISREDETMPLFEYQVRDKSGKDLTATKEAMDMNTLVSELKRQDYIVISIKETKGKHVRQQKRGRAKKVKLDDLVVFSRQMATMVEAGIPLVQTLDILSDQTENFSFQEIIKKVKVDVESGKSLSEAMTTYKKIFSHLFVSMVKAGESAGALDEILDRLATYLEKMGNLQKKIRAAMVYPISVISIALIITTLMLTFIVPKFAEIYSSLNAKLPVMTQMLIDFSYILKSQLIWVLAGLAAVIFAIRLAINTPQGRFLWDRLLLRLPVFGVLLLKSSVSKFARTLSTLSKSGVPILNALEIVGSTAGNKVIEQAVLNARNSIREGEGISGPLEASGIFPPMVTRMISVGEETGELEEMLAKIADFYESQVDTAVEGLSSLLEPIIIAFLGIVIGGIVIAMFLPILNLVQAIKT